MLHSTVEYGGIGVQVTEVLLFLFSLGGGSIVEQLQVTQA
jgi:hypothetical protein